MRKKGDITLISQSNPTSYLKYSTIFSTINQFGDFHQQTCKFTMQGHGFNILNQEYVSENLEQIFQFALQTIITENKSTAINFTLACYKSIFVISFSYS